MSRVTNYADLFLLFVSTYYPLKLSAEFVIYDSSMLVMMFNIAFVSFTFFH